MPCLTWTVHTPETNICCTSSQNATSATTSAPEAQPGQVTRKPEVMDDFLRNFFVKMGLARTCETFEAEWYELKATGKLEGSQLVPDIYQRNAVRNHTGLVVGDICMWGCMGRHASEDYCILAVTIGWIIF